MGSFEQYNLLFKPTADFDGLSSVLVSTSWEKYLAFCCWGELQSGGDSLWDCHSRKCPGLKRETATLRLTGSYRSVWELSVKNVTLSLCVLSSRKLIVAFIKCLRVCLNLAPPSCCGCKKQRLRILSLKLSTEVHQSVVDVTVTMSPYYLQPMICHCNSYYI